MKKDLSVFFTVILMFLSIALFAMPGNGNGPPGGGGPGPCPGGPPCGPPNPPGLAPIDGGVVFLLISGLILGVTKLRKKE